LPIEVHSAGAVVPPALSGGGPPRSLLFFVRLNRYQLFPACKMPFCLLFDRGSGSACDHGGGLRQPAFWYIARLGVNPGGPLPISVSGRSLAEDFSVVFPLPVTTALRESGRGHDFPFSSLGLL